MEADGLKSRKQEVVPSGRRAPSAAHASDAALLLEFDSQARSAAFALEMRSKLPPGFTEQHYPLTQREHTELRRLKAAAEAATNVDTFVALCKGDIVPAHRVDPQLLDYHRRRQQHRRSPEANGG